MENQSPKPSDEEIKQRQLAKLNDDLKDICRQQVTDFCWREWKWWQAKQITLRFGFHPAEIKQLGIMIPDSKWFNPDGSIRESGDVIVEAIKELFHIQSLLTDSICPLCDPDGSISREELAIHMEAHAREQDMSSEEAKKSDDGKHFFCTCKTLLEVPMDEAVKCPNCATTWRHNFGGMVS